MTARCYPCYRNVVPMPGTSATSNPHGVCKICQVLACQGHCQRNDNYPRVECVICIPALVAASTAPFSVDPGQLAQDLRALLERLGGEEAVIRSVEEFVARYPDLAELVARIDELMRRGTTSQAQEGPVTYYSSLPDEQRRLLLLAIVIMLQLDINPGLLPPPVQQLYRSWV